MIKLKLRIMKKSKFTETHIVSTLKTYESKYPMSLTVS